MVLATVVDQFNASWIDLWIESATCVRLAIPLRINQSQSKPFLTGISVRLRRRPANERHRASHSSDIARCSDSPGASRERPDVVVSSFTGRD